MTYGDWSTYGRQSYLQFGGGVQLKHTPTRHSHEYLAMRRPGQVVISWPGWQPLPPLSALQFRRRL